ncbi:hypothetical protein BSL78_27749 [Apostichopus japonicus]|uniref:Uncharacterized protein n=1 Tax=Stichopus japonicus TaxID=307972 RepID=A0A2G8JI50_STIJA|nr:hypothetical protein BSL78_27749 [Apostichopus japonicus]
MSSGNISTVQHQIPPQPRRARRTVWRRVLSTLNCCSSSRYEDSSLPTDEYTMSPQRSLQRSMRRRPSKRERQQTSSRKAGRRVKSKSSPPPHGFQCKLDGTDTVKTAPSHRSGNEQTRRIQVPLPSDQSESKLTERFSPSRNNQGNEGKCFPASSTNVLPSPIRLADNHSKDRNISLPQDTQPNGLGVGVCGVNKGIVTTAALELATQRKSLPSIWRKLPTEQKFQSLPIVSAIESRQSELKMLGALYKRKVQHKNEIGGEEMTRNVNVGMQDVPTRKGQLKVPAVEKNGGKG